MTKAKWLLRKRPRRFKVSNPKATYAVIIIMGGDGDLSPMIAADLKEMVEGFREEVSVLLLIDMPGVTGAVVAETTPTGIRNLDQFKELSTGDPRALAAFLARALVSYSSKTRLALGFWGHGQGVHGDNDSGEVLLPAALLRKLLPQRPRPPRRRARGVSVQGMLPDETSRDILTNREARSALAVAFARAERKRPIDMIFSDTCLNGSVEVYTELREFAKAIVASSFPVAGTGWDYRTWLEQTATDKPASAQEWALMAVKCFEERYPIFRDLPPKYHEHQIAAFSTCPDLVKAFGRVVKALMAMEQKPANLLLGEAVAQAGEHHIRHATTLDMQQLVQRLHDLAEGGPVKEACSSFLEAFSEAQIGISAQPYEDFPLGGLTIWVPIAAWHDQAGVGQYYRKLEFAKKTKWLKCLKQVFSELTHLRYMEQPWPHASAPPWARGRGPLPES